jgi:hypothetical protein
MRNFKLATLTPKQFPKWKWISTKTHTIPITQDLASHEEVRSAVSQNEKKTLIG